MIPDGSGELGLNDVPQTLELGLTRCITQIQQKRFQFVPARLVFQLARNIEGEDVKAAKQQFCRGKDRFQQQWILDTTVRKYDRGVLHLWHHILQRPDDKFDDIIAFLNGGIQKD